MTNDSELLVKISHRSLWLALALLLVLGAYAVIINLFPFGAAAQMAGKLALLLPISIVVAIGALRSSQKGWSADPNSKPMRAVLNDELRQQSVHRACRNGLLAVLLIQPVMGVVLTVVTVPHPVVLMASFTLVAGVATVLGSVLAYDR
jgi:hypothetical protein